MSILLQGAGPGVDGSPPAGLAWSSKSLPASVRRRYSTDTSLGANSRYGAVLLQGFNCPATPGTSRPLIGPDSFGAGSMFAQITDDGYLQVWFRNAAGVDCRIKSANTVTGSAKTSLITIDIGGSGPATSAQLYTDGVDNLDAAGSVWTGGGSGKVINWGDPTGLNLLGAHSTSYAGEMKWGGIGIWAGTAIDASDPAVWAKINDPSAGFGLDGSGLGAAAKILDTGSVTQINAGVTNFGTAAVTYSNNGAGGAQSADGTQTAWS